MQKQEKDIVLKMGMLRRIVVYNQPSPAGTQNEYQYLLDMPLVKQTFGSTDPVIVGMVNESDPLLQAANMAGSIYIYFSFLESGKLINIAGSIEKLKWIVGLLHTIWNGKENDVALLKTAENIQARKEFLKKIKKENPDADESFWDYLAFRELSINIQ